MIKPSAETQLRRLKSEVICQRRLRLETEGKLCQALIGIDLVRRWIIAVLTSMDDGNPWSGSLNEWRTELEKIQRRAT